VSELAHVPGPTDTYGPHCTNITGAAR